MLHCMCKLEESQHEESGFESERDDPVDSSSALHSHDAKTVTHQYATKSGGLEVTKQSSLKVSSGVTIARMYESPDTSAMKRAKSTASNMRFLLYSAYTVTGTMSLIGG